MPTGECTKVPPLASLTTVMRDPHSTPKNVARRVSVQIPSANGVSKGSGPHSSWGMRSRGLRKYWSGEYASRFDTREV